MRKLMTLVLAATVAACGGGGDDTPTGTTPTLDLALSVSTLTVQQGASGTATVTITRGGGLTANVDLSVEGAPTGVTATLTPASLGSGVTSSSLSVNVAAGAAVATTNLVVRAKSTGVADKTATIALTVTAASAPGSFTLAASAVTGSITQGGSGTSTITVTRAGAFTGPVGLAVTGAPTGLAATLNPTSVIATTSTLTISPAATTTPGTYTLTITGTATGASNATTTVAFTVAPATGGSGNVTFTFCASNAPIWLAAQDGSAGAWTRVTPGSNNDFRFNIASSTGGVAYVTAGASGAFTLNIVHATQAELIAQGTGLCPGGATKTLTGSVAGLAAGDASAITLGGASASTTGNGPFILSNVPSGLRDLVASDFAISGASQATTVKKLIIRRNLNLAANAVIPTLDFSAAEAFTPTTATISLANGGLDFLVSSSLYFTANGSAGGFATDVSAGAARTYYGFPAAQQQAGDLHAILAQAIVLDGTTPTQIRSATQYFKDLANRTLTFGPVPSPPTVVAVATTPVVRMRAQVVVQSEYNKSFVISYGQSNPSRSVMITISTGYLGGSPTSIDYTMPDLSGIAGWDNNWGLRALTSTSWSTSLSGWTFNGSSTSPVDAGVILTGTKLGTIIT